MRVPSADIVLTGCLASLNIPMCHLPGFFSPLKPWRRAVEDVDLGVVSWHYVTTPSEFQVLHSLVEERWPSVHLSRTRNDNSIRRFLVKLRASDYTNRSLRVGFL